MSAETIPAEVLYLIRKGGLFYRPNSQGYTAHTFDAGRYTLAEAEAITHPNGPDGPRDGLSYVPAPADRSTRPAEPAAPVAEAGDGEVSRYIAKCREMSKGENGHTYTWWSRLADLLSTLEAALSTPTEGPASQTEGMGGEPEQDYPDMEEHGLDEPLEEALREILLGGQGDDNGAQIMPDFQEGQSVPSMVHACIALLETRRDVIEGYANTEAQLRHRIAALTPPETAEAVPVGDAAQEAEAYIQAAVDRAPEPLRRLGEWLANKLDEDDWKTAERMLLGAATASDPAPATDDRERLVEAHVWQSMETAPRDGSHFLAVLHRDGIRDMDGGWMPAFFEVREIWFKHHTEMGMQLPWHAGDPYDTHDGIAPDHFGEDIPIAWMPLPARAALATETSR